MKLLAGYQQVSPSVPSEDTANVWPELLSQGWCSVSQTKSVVGMLGR